MKLLKFKDKRVSCSPKISVKQLLETGETETIHFVSYFRKNNNSIETLFHFNLYVIKIERFSFISYN